MHLLILCCYFHLPMKNTAERLGADGSVHTVGQHPFFKGIDWQTLEEKRMNPPEEEKVSVRSVF
jgi:hypothetical protein